MILDTNALTAFAGGDPGVGNAVRGAARVLIPVIVLGEYRYGLTQSKHRRTHEVWLATLLQHFEVPEITRETAECYAEVRAALRNLGRPIPANDTWIAALAQQLGMPILTRDRHFAWVPGIEAIGW